MDTKPDYTGTKPNGNPLLEDFEKWAENEARISTRKLEGYEQIRYASSSTQYAWEAWKYVSGAMEKELAAEQEMRKGLVKQTVELQLQILEERKELAAARAENNGLKHKLDECVRDMVMLSGRNQEVTEQRDRLAEALHRLMPFVSPIIGNNAYTHATEALQSLNTKNDE
jgi:hypothetical protein